MTAVFVVVGAAAGTLLVGVLTGEWSGAPFAGGVAGALTGLVRARTERRRS